MYVEQSKNAAQAEGNLQTDLRELLKHKKIQWQFAEYLASDRLASVNKASKPVHVKKSFYVKYGKRFIDIVVSIAALTVTLPINFVIGIVTYFDVGRPIFFKQERTGKDGKTFLIIKFRNMKNTVDSNGELLPASQRVTKWGKFVRKTSLDELLNFWSILKGDMSLIGPRPLPPQYLIRYSERHRARFSVRPGLECPPKDSVSKMRNWQDQFENDVWYVENVSLKTDLMLCIRLIQFALDSKNSDARAQVTRGSFIGYSQDYQAISVNQLSDEYIAQTIQKLDI